MEYREITNLSDLLMARGKDQFIRELSCGYHRICIVHNSEYRVTHIRLIDFIKTNLNIVLFPDKNVDVYELVPEDPDEGIVLATGVRYSSGQIGNLGSEIKNDISAVFNLIDHAGLKELLNDYFHNTKPEYTLPVWVFEKKILLPLDLLLAQADQNKKKLPKP